jgi:hypothetical protein
VCAEEEVVFWEEEQASWGAIRSNGLGEVGEEYLQSSSGWKEGREAECLGDGAEGKVIGKEDQEANEVEEAMAAEYRAKYWSGQEPSLPRMPPG